MYTHVHSGIIHHNKRLKQSKSHIKTDECMIEIYYIDTKEYYSALKLKEILTLITAWMNFKDTMQSEMNQSQKGNYCVILVILGTQNIHRHRK